MAGRPRLYVNSAEKNRAYRDRQEKRMMTVDRQWAEQSVKDMRRLVCAVHDAQKRGDELALSLRAVTTTEMMEDLAIYFECGVIAPRVTRGCKKPERRRPKPESNGLANPDK
jgi:hypothetical protein